MLPPVGNVVDVLARDPRFSTLVQLVKEAGLGDELQKDGPYTVFAPTNEVKSKPFRVFLTSDWITESITQQAPREKKKADD